MAVQKTFVVRDKVAETQYAAKQLGYYFVFAPSRSTSGRHSHCLVLLCKMAQTLQRVEIGKHGEGGGWAQHLLPFDDEFFGPVATLENRKMPIYRGSNFEPDELPIDLVNGGQANRPISDVVGTSPWEEVQLSYWIGYFARKLSYGLVAGRPPWIKKPIM
eukprot:5727854-Amphidinium_carterae.1